METSLLERLNTEEQLIQANLEKSVLLSITAEVASARNKTDLFKIVNNTLKKLFSYDDGVICIINDDLKTHSAFLYNKEEVFSKYPGSEQLAELKFSINDGVYDAIVAAEKVIVLELDELARLPNAAVYVPFWIGQGMTQLIGVPLRTALNTIGSFSFYTRQRNPIPESQFGLLYGICSQITIAIDNVLTNEQIEKNDLEKTILLNICHDLALSKDQADLGNVISRHLNRLVPFSHAVLGLKHTDGRLLCSYMNPEAGESKMENGAYKTKALTLSPELQKILARHDFPLLVRPGSGHEDFLRSFLNNLEEQSYSEAVFVCLVKDQKMVGFLVLFSTTPYRFKRSDINLLQGVGNHLSSVADNISVKEDIKQKEKEKSYLLSFSNHIVTVRDFHGLKFVIRKAMKELFQIRDYMIGVKNSDGTYSYFLHDTDVKEPDDDNFRVLTSSAKMSIKGTLTEAVLLAGGRQEFELSEIAKNKKYTFPAYSFWRAVGAESIVGIRLSVADEDKGMFWVEKDRINARLLQGICAQIAIALSNAMANAALEAQFNEIQHYKKQLEEENLYLQQEIDTNYNHGEIIGSGPEMQKVFNLLSQVAYANSTVLLLGETGTGKELVARAIHNYSSRKDKLMVKVNCAAFPTNLIESELFGHERGSFTGAFEQKIGKFELANNGTLFLDEIGEMPPDLQVKILRVLQEKEFERVGGKKTIKINVRIIAATNRDLVQEVSKGNFRNDLFYRLNVFPITLPPLRNRIEDIPNLVNHFITKLARNTGKQVSGIAGKALKELMAYNWPGNIRELEHMIERSILLSPGKIISQVYLPATDKKMKQNTMESDRVKTIDENERDHIILVLKISKGKIFGPGGAAELLGLPPSTLNSRMKKLGIKKELFYKNNG